MDKIVIIDGHSILHRAFYGVPDLTNSAGLHTNAVYGFLNIMFKILEEEKPEYLAVAFDVHAPTFRHKRYAEYKGNRKPMPEELREQVPIMKELLTAMGIRIMELAGYEADDLIGTLSAKAEKAGIQAVILSGDRDLLQLASDETMVRIPKTKGGVTEVENYLAKDVVAAYQVDPRTFIELKGLMGDASDNIPGLPGVGQKTATKILLEFGSIENAYAHASEVKPPKAAKALLEHYDLALLSRDLATIDRNAPLSLEPAECRLSDIFTPEAVRQLQILEFKSMVGKYTNAKEQKEKPRDFIVTLSDPDEIQRQMKRAEEAKRISLQCAGGSGILAIAFAYDDMNVYFAQSESFPEEKSFCELVVRLFSRAEQISCIGLKEQLVWLEDERIYEKPLSEERLRAAFGAHVSDCSIAAYLLNPLKNTYDYDDIARDYLGITDFTPPGALKGKDSPQTMWENRPEDLKKLLGLAARTAYLTAPVLEEKLRETGMYRLFRETEMPLVYSLHRMEKAGIRVDAEELSAYGVRLVTQIEVLTKDIYELAGETFNINSPKQLGEILFVKMKIPGGKKTKTGYSTAADVLEKLAPDYPLIEKVLDYRTLTKLYSTYVEGLSVFIQKDGRIHGTFHQTITATGRISSTDPNLQNIPVRMEIGREIRKVFKPKDGCVFVDADYSQIELRILAHMAEDENLRQAYREEQDIHRITASKVFHVPLSEVTPEQRRNAKAVNFGVVYGISSFGLSQGLSINRKEAEQYIRQYFETYPGVRRFLDSCVSDAKEKGYSITMFGRRRPVPELKSGNYMQRSFGERIAMNSPIQGTAADIIKIAMIRVEKRILTEGLKSRIVLQVHDELLVETELSEIDRVKEILLEEMQGAADLSIPLEIGMAQGSNWFEAH